MNTLCDRLVNFLAEHGLKASIVDYRHMDELIAEIDGRYEAGELDKKLYEAYLSRFRRKFGSSGSYKSVIVIAVPDMPAKLEFAVDDEIYSVTVPPTYVYGDMCASVDKLVKEYLEPLGYSSERPVLPYKLLAVRSGLGRYGRNNVCYVPQFGSFHRIIAYYSDMPCDRDNWQAALTMERCSSCKICMNSCPTGCIARERFLIHAESCLTYLNENAGEFPEWLEPKAHNAIVGCMSCQAGCPENRGFMKNMETIEGFDSGQTKMLLEGVPFGELPGELTAKLDRLCLSEYYDVLPRNLGVLVKK